MPLPFIEAYCIRSWSTQVGAALKEVREALGMPSK
jgi:hypothetical protein